MQTLKDDIAKEKTLLKKKKEEFRENFIKLEEMNSKNEQIKKELENYHPLKMELLTLQNEILKQQTRISALKAQLQITLNVHRWRKIEATDPEKFELIMKIQEIQRNIIEKSDQIQKQEQTIREKEAELFEYKNVIARYQYSNADEEIVKFQQTIKDKTQNMKQMVFELKNSKAQIEQLSLEIEVLKSKITKSEQEYFEKRKNEEIQILKMNKENLPDNLLDTVKNFDIHL